MTTIEQHTRLIKVNIQQGWLPCGGNRPMKIANAFSIAMLPTREITTAFFAGPRSAERIKTWLADNVTRYTGKPATLESVIGHADTAKLISSQLGVDLPANRVSVKLELGEQMIVAQYSGPRLPEGTTELPEGARIDYFIVTVAAVE